MYPLSKDVDLSFLIGIELSQVCVGKNEVILHFDPEARLTILSDFAVSEPGAGSIRYGETTIGGVALFRLLHDVVVQAKATEKGGLLLQFRSGASLEALETSEQYESFWIEDANHRIIV